MLLVSTSKYLVALQILRPLKEIPNPKTRVSSLRGMFWTSLKIQHGTSKWISEETTFSGFATINTCQSLGLIFPCNKVLMVDHASDLEDSGLFFFAPQLEISGKWITPCAPYSRSTHITASKRIARILESHCPTKTMLVVEPTHLKTMLVKLGSFSQDRDENTKKYLKAPTFKTWQECTLWGVANVLRQKKAFFSWGPLASHHYVFTSITSISKNIPNP